MAKRARGRPYSVWPWAPPASSSLWAWSRPPILDNGVDLNLLAPAAYAASQAKVLLTYFLRCFVLPAGLSISPPFAAADGFSDPLAILGSIALAGMIASLWWLRRNPVLFFGMLLTVMGILPNIIILQHEIVSDQRFYLSVAGLCLMAGWLLTPYLTDTKNARSVVLEIRSLKITQVQGAVLALLIVLAGLTLWRESAWLSQETVWEQALKQNAEDARSIAMVADVFRVRGLADKATELANKALKIDPDSPTAYEALGQNQLSLRNYALAQSYMQKAYDEAKKRKTAQDKQTSYTEELADACRLNRDWPKTDLYAEEALATRPNSVNLLIAKGQALLNENKPMLALQALFQAQGLDPTNPEVVEPMADAALKIGGRKYVEFAFQTAGRGMHVTLTGHVNFAFVRAALQLGRVQAATDRLEKILIKEPRNPEALLCMSYAMHLLRQEKVAYEWEKRALAIDPQIKEKIVLKPVDKDAEHPTDIGRDRSKPPTFQPLNGK